MAAPPGSNSDGVTFDREHRTGPRTGRATEPSPGRSGAVAAYAPPMTGVVDGLLAGAGVRFAYLYGSRATGGHRPDSDADIAVVLIRPLELLEEAILADRLAQAMGVPAVDLLDLERASLRMRGRVLTEGRPIFSTDEPGRVEFEVRTRSEYFDFLPTQLLHRDAFLRRVAAGGLDG